MRIQPCFLLIPLLVGTSTVLAKSENCVPDKGCPADQWPPRCCQEPPCEFWNALEEARATVRTIRVARLSFPGLDDEIAQQEYEKFSKQVRDEIRKIRKKLPKCKLKGKHKNPPIFSLDYESKDCRIMTYANKTFQHLELPDAQRVLDGCEEIVEAKYESAYIGSTFCAMEAVSPYERMQERHDRAVREMTVLEDRLIQYWRACTIAPDFEPAEIIINNSVDVLKRFNFFRQWSPPPAKRAGR